MARANSHEAINTEQMVPSLEIKIPLDNHPLSIHTAPTSPVRLSPTHLNLGSGQKHGSLTPNKIQLSIPFRAHTEALDLDKAEFESLFSERIQTDPGDFEDHFQFNQKKEGYLDVKRKTSLRSLQNLIEDIKKASGNRSYSATKHSKIQKELSTTPKKASKVSGEKDKDKEKDSYKSRKRPLSSNERINDSHSRSREEKNHGDKKVIKTAVKDLELDFGMAERCNTDEGPDDLFEEGSSEREVKSCKNSREAGPIRYSKMSEEDAALMFEIRRKELLSFLKKLGANATLIKKKQSYRKPGIPKQGGSVSGQISEFRRNELEREHRMRAVKEALKESLSPTTFIIYNNNHAESILNGLTKARTPLKESNKKQAASFKNISESVSDTKRRNSVKSYREKEESTTMVSRNLEASFNRIAQDLMMIEASEKKVRRPTKTTERLVGSVEEKREGFESIKIDLKKELLKKKKKKKVVAEDKSVVTVEKVIPKKSTEEIDPLQIAPQVQVKESKEVKEKNIVNQQLIETMRKKNKEVLGDIEEIDIQIQRMEAEKNTKQNKGRGQNTNGSKTAKKKEEIPPPVIPTPPPQEVYEESLEGSYAYSAKMKRSKSRPRSMNVAGSFYSEGIGGGKQQESGPKDVGSAVARTWKEKNVGTTSRSTRWDEVESKERQSNNKKNLNEKNVININKVEQQSKNVQQNNNPEKSPKWINVREEKSITRQTQESKTALKNEPISQNNNLIKSKRHSASTNMKSLDLGRGKLDAQKIDNYKSPKDTREYLSPKLDNNKRNVSFTPTPTLLQGTQYSSLANSTPPVSELFQQNKSAVVPHESVKNKKQSMDSLIDNSKSQQKIRKEPYSASSVQKLQTSRKSSEVDNQSEKGNIKIGSRHERHSAANIHENPRSPKISFFDEVKKILKEGAKDEQRKTPTSLTDTTKPVQKVKKEPINKPKFDFAPSMDIRSKIYKDSRPLDELTKSVKIPGVSSATLKKRDPQELINVYQKEAPMSLELENVANNYKSGSEPVSAASERLGVGASKSLEKGISSKTRIKSPAESSVFNKEIENISKVSNNTSAMKKKK